MDSKMGCKEKSPSDQDDSWDIEYQDIVEFLDVDVDAIDPNDILTNGDNTDAAWQRL
jgi:hypothetical protein